MGHSATAIGHGHPVSPPQRGGGGTFGDAPHAQQGGTVKVTRYDAPVPVKSKTGRMPSELTVTLSKAIDDITATGNSQRYDASDRDEADRVAVRIRQIASKKRQPVSVAVVFMNGKDVVIFGPREGVTTAPQDHADSETMADLTAQLREVLAKLEKMEKHSR